MKKIITIADLPKGNIFKVPEGYFDTLSVSVQQRLASVDEPVVNFGKKQTLAVPDNYFDTLSARIMTRIAHTSQEGISLEHLPKVNVFTVPEGYFESAAANIKALAKLESIEKKNIFEVPAGYFDQLPASILSKTNTGRSIEVNWWQKSRTIWSAAASLVLMIGLGFALPRFSQSASEAAFAALSKEEVSNYLTTQDLSYLEYDLANAVETALPKGIETRIIDDLEINKADILEHLEDQDMEDI